MKMHKEIALFEFVRASTLKKITSLITAFMMMFQLISPAVASVLKDSTIQESLDGNLNFERVSDDLYQYVIRPIILPPVLSNLTVDTFYQSLHSGYKHILGPFVQAPIAVGDITIFVPSYKSSSYKNVGDNFVQDRYIRTQIKKLLGRNLINSDLPQYANNVRQVHTLYNNTRSFLATKPNLKFGDKLSLSQVNNQFSKDFIWPEFRIINGEKVVVPIVYLTKLTVQNRGVDKHIIEFNGETSFEQLEVDEVDIQFGRKAFLNIAGDLLNNGSSLSSSGDFKIVVGGTLNNASGIIQATGDLSIAAHSLMSETLVYRYDLGNSQGSRFGQFASFSSGGDMVLRSYSDISLVGTDVTSGGEITLGADGSIYLGSSEIYNKFLGDINGKYVKKSSVEYLTSKLTAEDTIKIIANGEVLIDAAEIVSNQGHIELLAGLGIMVDSDLASSNFYTKGKFGKKKKEVSRYQTVAIRALLDADKGIRLASEFGDITLKSAKINSSEGTSVNAKNGKVNLLMTTENDHYRYSSVKKDLFTVQTKNRGFNIKRGIPNTIIGGFSVEALSGVTIEYKGDSSLTLDEQVAVLARFEGLEWMADVRASAPDANWVAIEEQYEKWKKDNTSISPAFAAVISIAAAVVTGGSSLAITGTIVNAAITQGLNAVIISLASKMIISLANGVVNGDISQALNDLASEETLKSLVVSMVTAGALSSIDADIFNLGNTFGLSKQAAQAVTSATVRAGVTSIAYGRGIEGFGESLVQNLAQSAVNELGAYMANKIKLNFASSTGEEFDIALKYIAHAGAGCVLGVATATVNNSSQDTSCAVGASGAVIGELIAEGYKETASENAQKIDDFLNENGFTGLDDINNDNARVLNSFFNDNGIVTAEERRALLDELQELQTTGVNLSKLSVAVGAFISGATAEEIEIAATTSENAAQNNAVWFVFLGIGLIKAIDVILTADEYYSLYLDYSNAKNDEDKKKVLSDYFKGKVEEHVIEQILKTVVPGVGSFKHVLALLETKGVISPDVAGTIFTKEKLKESTKTSGYYGELNASIIFEAEGFIPVGKTMKVRDIDDSVDGITDAMNGWYGQTGIDGIYKKDGKWIIIESKATGSDATAGRWDIKDPTNTKGGLTKTQLSGRQLSDEWIIKDLNRQLDLEHLSSSDYSSILEEIGSNTLTRVLVRTSEDNIQFYKVNKISKTDVVVGEKFQF